MDILGFDQIPKDLARMTDGDEDFIREKFLKEPVIKTIQELENKITDVSIGHIGTDNFLITCMDLSSLFRILGLVTQIKIPNKNFNNISLEIAVDFIEEPETKIDISNKSSTINFWKSNLIKKYKSTIHDSIKETFVLFTASVYDQLDILDKGNCKEFENNNKYYYSIRTDIFSQKQQMTKFLDLIERPGHVFYNRIDSLFVPPKEFDEIKNTLLSKQIVFITGTKEFGKTYTAVRLLWDFYKKGYTPKWIGGEDNEQMRITRDKLIQIESELKPKHVIYFEDPFGRTKYEATETLEREIKIIIENVEQIEDVFVIITSREEVFKEFEKEKLSDIDLKQFERKLNI